MYSLIRCSSFILNAHCSACTLTWLLGFILGLGVASPPVFAKHTSIDLTRFSLEELMQIEVYSASKFGQQANEAPSAVTVITAEDIKAQGYRTLTDILRSLPGVYVSYDRNYSSVGVRGFSRPGDYNDHLLFLIDGHRLNDNIYDAALVGTDFILDVDLIKRVEFLPAGPATALYGNNAFFGVVSITTKQGRDIGALELSGAVASAETNRGRATFGRKLDNGFDLLLSATAYDSQGKNLYFPEFDRRLTSGVAMGLDHDSFQQLFGKLSFEGWSLELAHSNREKGIPTASYGQDFNDPRSRTQDQQAFMNLAYRAPWSADFDVQGRLFYGAYDYHGHYIYEDADFPDQAIGRWWGTELQFVSTAFERHKLAFGGEYQRDLRRDQAAFDETGAVAFDSRIHGHRWGLYALDEFALGEKTNFGIGIRYDRAASGDNSINPRLSLVHQWDGKTTFKFLYSEAFRAPNAYERYYTPSGYLLNPSLQPETINTYEFILEKRLDEHTRLNASIYHYDITDLIDLTTDPDSELLTFRNLGQVRANGFTLEAERHWTNGARLRASYSWQLVEDEAGAWLDNAPRHLAKLNWNQPLSGDIWRTGLELQYISKRRATQGNEVAGALITNLNLLGQPFGKNLDVALGIYNLFDQDYADPGGDEHFQAEIPQDGRSWRLKLDYRF